MSRNNIRKKRLWPWFVGFVVVVALAVVSVQFFGNGAIFPDDPPATTSVPANNPKGIGEGVTVSGTVPTEAKATKATGSEAVPPFKQYTEPWDVVNIEPTGKLSAPMRITLPLNRKVTKNDIVVVVVNHSHKADGWQILKGVYAKPGDTSISFAVTELSWFTPGWFDLGKMGEDIKKQFFDGFTDGLFAKADPPSCPNESAALRDDYKLDKGSQDTALVCIDMQDGKRFLKVVNNSKYQMEIKRNNMTIKSRADISLDMARLADFGDHLVIPPRDSAELWVNSLKHGDTATLDSEASKLALSLQAVDTLVKALLSALTKVNIGKVADKAKVLDTILGTKECQNVLFDLNIGSILAHCLNDEMLQQIFDWKAVILLPVTVFLSGANLGAALANAFDDGVNNKNQHVVVSRPKPNPLAGFITASDSPWHVHGFDMYINRDGTGSSSWNAGPCDNTSIDVDTPMCTGHSTYTFTRVGDDKIKGTVTGLWFTITGESSRYDGYDATGQRPVGASFTLNHRPDTHLLDWKWDNPSYNSSEAVLCDAYASARNNTEQYMLCGA